MHEQSEKEVNDKLDYLLEIEEGRIPDFAILESYSNDHESLIRAETATALLYCFNEQAEQILLRLVRDSLREWKKQKFCRRWNKNYGMKSRTMFFLPIIA